MYEDKQEKARQVVASDSLPRFMLAPHGTNPRKRASTLAKLVVTLLLCAALLFIFVTQGARLAVGGVDELFAMQHNDTRLFTLAKDQYAPTAPHAVYGEHFGVITLNKGDMLRLPETEQLIGGAFNLALLRLPSGLRWEYIGVSRGPINRLSGEWIQGTSNVAEIQSLVGFGANLTADGRFAPVSKVSTLLIPTRSAYGCYGSAFNRGPEDPRLQWSAARTPMLTFGFPSMSGACRGIGLVHDLRSVWPDLASTMASALGTRPYVAGDFGDEIVELTRDKANFVEKNWMAFYPGAVAAPTEALRMPLIHYKSWPETNMEPSMTFRRNGSDQMPIWDYRPVADVIPDWAATCVAKHHPHTHTSIHGATPFSRLTLCPRNKCTPDEHNTVFAAINHLKLGVSKQDKLIYGRFFSFWNVTAPFAPVAVGPQFHYAGPDDEDIVYSMSLTFVPHLPRSDKATLAYGPTHGFLDDRLFVGLGLGDDRIGTIELSVRNEMLADLRRCSPV